MELHFNKKIHFIALLRDSLGNIFDFDPIYREFLKNLWSFGFKIVAAWQWKIFFMTLHDRGKECWIRKHTPKSCSYSSSNSPRMFCLTYTMLSFNMIKVTFHRHFSAFFLFTKTKIMRWPKNGPKWLFGQKNFFPENLIYFFSENLFYQDVSW